MDDQQRCVNGKKSTLTLEPAFFDGMHKRTRGFKKLTTYFTTIYFIDQIGVYLICPALQLTNSMESIYIIMWFAFQIQHLCGIFQFLESGVIINTSGQFNCLVDVIICQVVHYYIFFDFIRCFLQLRIDW